MAGPKLINPQELISAGINPKTGLPYKMGDPNSQVQFGVKRFFDLIDEQDAINRYKWYNLPCDLSGQELERMLYYKGQLCFFYMEDLDQFFFMPYALDGTIDFYGRYNTIHPVPMTSGTTDDNKAAKAQADYLSTLKLKCYYGIQDIEELTYDDLMSAAVLLHDYSKELSQTITPRKYINEPIINVMSETIPFLRTALISGTGIKGVRVNDADQAQNVKEGAKTTLSAALNGEPYVPIVGNIEFQELTDGSVLKAEEYLLSLQSLDNLRLSGYGLDNGGIFQKKAHELQSEANMASANVGLIYQDGLTIRQNFCHIVNSIWGLGIWCEPSESVLGVDQNMDGAAYDREGQSGAAVNNGGAANENDNAETTV